MKLTVVFVESLSDWCADAPFDAYPPNKTNKN
jgi:hypothetical protein